MDQATGGDLRGPEAVLLEDSVVRVRQQVPSLAPEATEALRADAYAAPVAAGVDADTEFTYVASAEQCFVWRTAGAAPTVYAFPVPPGGTPQVLLLPRPLNASAEPALLLCGALGQVRFWDAVSDAITAAAVPEPVAAQLPLATGERITAATRVDASQAVVATSAARLFRVHVYVHRGAHHLATSALEAAQRGGLLGRWLGVAEPAGAITRLLAAPPHAGDAASLVYALSAHGVQVWRVPLAAGTAPAAARLLLADAHVQKTVAQRVLNAAGRRYSAADAQSIEIVDGALTGARLALLYRDRSSAGGASFGLALVDVADGALTLARLVPLRFRAPDDPRPGAAPRLVIAATQPPAVAVAFDRAVVTQLLGDAGGAEDALRLKHGDDRVLGACVAHVAAQQLVRFAVLTSASGLLLVDMDVGAAHQRAIDEQPSQPEALAAQTARLYERLERVVWFGEDAANPLQLDALPDDLDAALLAGAAERLSGAIVSSSLSCMGATVDLRTQLAQRVACARRLAALIGGNGYLMRLPPATRARLLADAELLAGALDLWRFYDDSRHAGVLSGAVAALGCDARVFFERELAQMPALFDALARAAPRDALECTRLVLALLFGAARFRTEHGAAYAVGAADTPFVPWHATPACIALLETLFAATRSAAAAAAAADAERRSQLCALAEFALAAHAAAAAADPAARAAYDAARPALLFPLVEAHRADRAFALAEAHRDFATLTALCFAGRTHDAKRARHDVWEGTSARDDARVEQYLDTYGAAFADELYTFYIQHGAYRRLLTPAPEHAPLLSAFLAARPQYERVAWLHDVGAERFAAAAATLDRAARAAPALPARQALLSLGKLAVLAALPSVDAAAAPATQAALEPWDDALDLVHVQERLANKWAAALGPGDAPELGAARVADAAAAELAARPALRALFVQCATDLAAARAVSAEDLVDLLTLQDAAVAAPADAALTDYALAAQVLVRMDAPAPRRAAACAALWRRVYLVDDWHALSDAAHKTDDEVLASVRASVAFGTVQAVLANPSTAPLVLSPDAACAAPPADAALLAERLPGLPAPQIEAVHAELAAEQAALAALLRTTKLRAFFAQVLAVPAADAEPEAAAAAPVPMPGGVL